MGKSSSFLILSSNFDRYFLFSSNFSHFLPHFAPPPPGASRPPGKALATPLVIVVEFYQWVAKGFSGGRLVHYRDQNEEENEENLRKNERNYGEKVHIEEMVLFYPPESLLHGCMATALRSIEKMAM